MGHFGEGWKERERGGQNLFHRSAVSKLAYHREVIFKSFSSKTVTEKRGFKLTCGSENFYVKDSD